ncbi:hypothetical protein PINS_up005686 [Pythium insidiosum]|nr:hypothetical protein PINS_up005686 [Pythium insidiosum]
MSFDASLTCCNDRQYLSIFLIVTYAVLIFKLWRLVILHPLKILTVFLHELGHATAAWLTCGKVRKLCYCLREGRCDRSALHGRQVLSMEVHPDEGGVTRTKGGIQWIIVSAGYTGSAVWGMGLVIASAHRLSAEIAAGVLIFFLALFIYYANNWYLRTLNLGFIVLLGGLLALNIWTNSDPLQYVTLLIGVMSCLFSIYDIWDDLISRRVNESDASVFAKMTHTSSRCWGVIWGLIAVASLGAAVYFNLLVSENDGEPISSLSDASKATRVALYTCIGIVVLSLIHTAVTRRCMVQKMRSAPSHGAGNHFTAAV